MEGENSELTKPPNGKKTGLATPASNRASKLSSLLRLVKLGRLKQKSPETSNVQPDNLGNSKKDLTHRGETEKRVKSFKTAKGSVYTYDKDGKTTRYKTASQEPQDRQDITVFVNLSLDEEQEVLRAYRHVDDAHKNSKVYVLEKQRDGKPKVIREIGEITDPQSIYLAVLTDGNYSLLKKASTIPTIGQDVFDSRQFKENGQWFTERHFGNKVTEIEYAD